MYTYLFSPGLQSHLVVVPGERSDALLAREVARLHLGLAPHCCLDNDMCMYVRTCTCVRTCMYIRTYVYMEKQVLKPILQYTIEGVSGKVTFLPKMLFAVLDQV